MDVTESTQTTGVPGGGAAIRDAACPRCDEMLPPLPSVSAAALENVSVRRCRRCGTRSTSETIPRFVFSCEGCGIPFITSNLLPHGEHNCPSCCEGQIPADLPDAVVVRATEREVRAALAGRWRFVTKAGVGEYVERVTRQVARRVEGAPASSRVFLVEDSVLRTLALPSGSLLITTGVLAFLEDEAELAFVLGHELVHAASGDAAVRLVRMGFDAVSRGPQNPAPDAWAAAGMDLVVLGYGRRRERDADARALVAMLGQDYDPESAIRFLRRLDGAVEAGDAAVAELAVAHPPAADRLHRLERSLWGSSAGEGLRRVNREVYRRAAGPAILASGFTAVSLPSSAKDVAGDASDDSDSAGAHRWGWWVAAVVVAAAAAAAALLFVQH